jgi:hypothetical protein
VPDQGIPGLWTQKRVCRVIRVNESGQRYGPEFDYEEGLIYPP